MLKIRLQRVGKKHDPSFRVVLVDSRRGPQSGNFIEVLGSYDARKGEPVFKDAEKIKKCVLNGAQISGTVNNLLVKTGVIEGKIMDVMPKLSKKKKAEIAKVNTETKTTKETEAKTAPAIETEETEPVIEAKPTEAEVHKEEKESTE